MKHTIISILLGIAISFTFTACKKEGCTDPIAENFDSDASKDDGSCTYINGCTDASASNYNPNATKDDGSCKYEHYLSFRVTCYNSTYIPVGLKIVICNFNTTQELVSGSTDGNGWFALPYAYDKNVPLRIEIKDFDNRCIMYIGITEGITVSNAPSIFVESTTELGTNDDGGAGHFHLGTCQSQYPETSGCW